MTLRRMMDGERFGSWTVIEAYPRDGLRPPQYARCRCDCGYEGYVSRGALCGGQSMRCRPCWQAMRRVVFSPRQRKMENGETFGLWTVIDAYPKRPPWPSGQPRQDALCRCACGREQYVTRGALQSGLNTQCRMCLLAQKHDQRVNALRSHGWELLESGESGAATIACSTCGTTRRLTTGRNPARCWSCHPPKVGAAAIAIATREAGISRQAVDLRLNRGWTLEEAITTPRGQQPARLRRK